MVGCSNEMRRIARYCHFLISTRLGNCLVRVSVFCSKSCVFLAVCRLSWPKILGTYDLRSS